MRYLLLADIHSNLEALKTVLGKAKSIGYDRMLVVGDIVGYYAEPNECIELLQKEKEVIFLRGNHDAAVSGVISTEEFSKTARLAVEWTQKEITEENKKFLKELPKFFSIPFMLAVHGTPFNPLWEYMNEESAEKTLEKVPEHVTVCGHNHVCFQYTKREGMKYFNKSTFLSLQERSVISLPSVGQSRDANTQTGFSLIDFEKQEMRVERISYDLEKTIAKIEGTDLPREEVEKLKRAIE